MSLLLGVRKHLGMHLIKFEDFHFLTSPNFCPLELSKLISFTIKVRRQKEGTRTGTRVIVVYLLCQDIFQSPR